MESKSFYTLGGGGEKHNLRLRGCQFWVLNLAVMWREKAGWRDFETWAHKWMH